MIAFRDLVKAIHDVVLTANDSLVKRNTDILEQYFEPEELEEDSNQDNAEGVQSGQVLKPKIVKLCYPKQISNGIVHRDVHVPLISIMPIAFTHITQVKFKTKLEVQDIDDNIIVSFPKKADYTGDTILDPEGKHYTELEITIEPYKGSAGLNMLIEGYEKMLRSQIPS